MAIYGRPLKGLARFRQARPPVEELANPAQSRDPRDVLFSAIKAGAFRLRKTARPAGATSAEAQLGEQPEPPSDVPASGMGAMLQRARALRASAYPDSTVSGSDAS